MSIPPGQVLDPARRRMDQWCNDRCRRVVGLSTASIPVAAPIGVLITGSLLDGLGLHQTLLLMTAGAAIVGATVRASKGIRVFDANWCHAEGC
jgi:hypothetical protein